MTTKVKYNTRKKKSKLRLSDKKNFLSKNFFFYQIIIAQIISNQIEA